MRPGNNNNRRGRNRGQRKPHGGMPNKSQNFDSGGSDTRVRGNVYQVLEKERTVKVLRLLTHYEWKQISFSRGLS